jgi:hypothetical protein
MAAIGQGDSGCGVKNRAKMLVNFADYLESVE